MGIICFLYYKKLETAKWGDKSGVVKIGGRSYALSLINEVCCVVCVQE